MTTGRKPKPTALKILEGNPGRRPLNKNEPALLPLPETPPDWLTPFACKEWAALYKEFDGTGILTALDTTAVAVHCALYAEIVASQKKGEPLRISLLAQLRSFMAELGLTPASRTRIFSTIKNAPSFEDEFF